MNNLEAEIDGVEFAKDAADNLSSMRDIRQALDQLGLGAMAEMAQTARGTGRFAWKSPDGG